MENLKIKKLSKLTSLKLQLNTSKIDFRYGRISIDELREVELKYQNELNNQQLKLVA